MIFNNCATKNNKTSQFNKKQFSKYYYLKRSEPFVQGNIITEKPLKESKSDVSVRDFFQKKFQFNKQSHWKLPVDVFVRIEQNVTVSQLKCIKSQLNGVKNKLNDIPLDIWSRFTEKRDPSSNIAWFIRTDIKAEFVTKAWCKFYECLSAYPVIIDNAKQFNSVHLCEAPGAFVAALNHFLKLNYPSTKFHWVATTLNPYYEGNSVDDAVLDDRLMVRTFHNWEFGNDFTGDVTNVQNIEKLVQRCRKMGKISLVTADGSVDCSEYPHDQENKVHYLHFAEVVAALRILDMGGSFVLKMFTFYELTTVGLLYFLNNVFDNVNVFKPAASKQGNSEVYVICIGFHRLYKTLNYLHKMTDQIQHNGIPMFPLDAIPTDFINQVFNCAEHFMRYQIKAIESNISYFFASDNDDKPDIHDLHRAVRREYIRLYNLKPIPDELKLLQGESCSDIPNMNTSINTYSGSYTSRSVFKKLTKEEKQLGLLELLQETTKKIAFQCRAENSPLVTNNEFHKILNIQYGKPIRQARSSKFVLIQCLKLLIDIKDNCKDDACDDSIVSVNSNSECSVISVDVISFKNVQNFDRFEKDFFAKLIDTILGSDAVNRVCIKNFLLLTHFSVGFIYALGCVFEEILLTSDGEIQLNSLRIKGKDFLSNILLNQIELSPTNSNRAALAVVHVKYLRNNDFFKSVMTYNNKLTIKYCMIFLRGC